jgi:uncharacterized protein (DUF2236 family)
MTSNDLQGLFGPGSITWQVNREAVLLLGGGRALLMQIAHPAVAAGVDQHSDFRRDPFGRLRRTLEFVHAVTFGTGSEARAAIAALDRMHAKVRGTLGEDVGKHRSEKRYRARDPKLLFWVHATLVDTALLVYERTLGRLTDPERERYYEESKVTARLFGIPERLVPKDLAAFERYMERMIGAELAVGETGRELARSVLYPPVALVPPQAFELLNLVTVGLLPGRLRDQFRLPWGAARQLLFDASTTALRALLPVLPDLVRAMPPARAAERRAAGAPP